MSLCCDSAHAPVGRRRRGHGHITVSFVALCPDCGLEHEGKHALPPERVIVDLLARLLNAELGGPGK